MCSLRVQHERHDYESLFSKENYHRLHGLTQERYDRGWRYSDPDAPSTSQPWRWTVDHSGEAPKSRIAEQMTNGVSLPVWPSLAVLKGRGAK